MRGGAYGSCLAMGSHPGQALFNLGVSEDNIYTDHGLTGTNRDRPGLDQAIAAVREGDTLVVPRMSQILA